MYSDDDDDNGDGYGCGDDGDMIYDDNDDDYVLKDIPHEDSCQCEEAVE